MRVLIVEDARAIAESISEYLNLFGYVCDFAYDGLAGLQMARQNEYDIYVLDISMPKMNGLDLCKELKQISDRNPGVIFLTARDTLEDKLIGFSCGGDDYLVKPFRLEELKARIEAIYNRCTGPGTKVLTLENLHVNLDTCEVQRNNKNISLTKSCYKLLVILLKNAPAVVTRETLNHELWADEFPDSDSLKSHIYRLRQEIDKPFDSALIHTVQGVGFRMAVK
ncbi:response regulator transcription factor [Teredinibacter sp. KSP-S5-2]|uniref:response regulator transcription factor n=1 Tax=Teredinibacter sp. KSP-S5-2 TaxID=3034506 RepID=UPI002934D26E|nr:response regulator transcription factor [Teredinibacter sp. KSP-S5-2]WNO11155.1 response regulator transcription factor [Teredinibacter sp. KSP-S5-2]